MDVVKEATKSVARAINADQCAIALLEDGEAGQLRLTAIYNPSGREVTELPTLTVDEQPTLESALRHMQQVHIQDTEADAHAIAARLVAELNLPPFTLNPLVVGTVAAHLRAAATADLTGPS